MGDAGHHQSHLGLPHGRHRLEGARHHYSSSSIDIVSKGGNYLLNVGPTARGRDPAGQPGQPADGRPLAEGERRGGVRRRRVAVWRGVWRAHRARRPRTCAATRSFSRRPTGASRASRESCISRSSTSHERRSRSRRSRIGSRVRISSPTQSPIELKTDGGRTSFTLAAPHARSHGHRRRCRVRGDDRAALRSHRSFFISFSFRPSGMVEIEGIERIAARDEAKPGSRRAVAERPADLLALERPSGEHVSRQLRIGEHHASEPDDVGHSLADGELRDVRQPVLQVAVRGSNEYETRKRRLEPSPSPRCAGQRR